MKFSSSLDCCKLFHRVNRFAKFVLNQAVLGEHDLNGPSSTFSFFCTLEPTMTEKSEICPCNSAGISFCTPTGSSRGCSLGLILLPVLLNRPNPPYLSTFNSSSFFLASLYKHAMSCLSFLKSGSACSSSTSLASTFIMRSGFRSNAQSSSEATWASASIKHLQINDLDVWKLQKQIFLSDLIRL